MREVTWVNLKDGTRATLLGDRPDDGGYVTVLIHNTKETRMVKRSEITSYETATFFGSGG